MEGLDQLECADVPRLRLWDCHSCRLRLAAAATASAAAWAVATDGLVDTFSNRDPSSVAWNWALRQVLALPAPLQLRTCGGGRVVRAS